MLGVCHELEKITGIDRFIFQVLFIIWFCHNSSAIFWYILLALIL